MCRPSMRRISGLQTKIQARLCEVEDQAFFKKPADDDRSNDHYARVTGELDISDGNIIDTCRGLWQIEETFKVTKGTIKTRPVYVLREIHIGAHFHNCFIALAIIGLIGKKTGRKYAMKKIITYPPLIAFPAP